MGSDSGINSTPKVGEGLSTIELLTKTLALWIRNIKSYIIIAGMVLALFTMIQASVAFFLYASLNATVFANDIGAFLTMLINGVLFPEIVSDYYFLNLGISLILVFLGLFVNAIVASSVIKFALEDLTSQNPDVGISMSTGFSMIIPMFLLQGIIGLISGTLLAPGQAVMAFGLVTDNFEMILNGLSLFGALGFLALVILVRITPSPVVLVSRNKSPRESLNISFELSRGKSLHIAIGWILVLVFVFFVDLIFSVIISMFAFSLGTDLATLIVSIINDLLLAPIIYIFYTMVYADLVSRPGITKQDWW